MCPGLSDHRRPHGPPRGGRTPVARRAATRDLPRRRRRRRTMQPTCPAGAEGGTRCPSSSAWTTPATRRSPSGRPTIPRRSTPRSGVSHELDRGYFGDGLHRPGTRRARPRAPARRRARDHAPADLRRLAAPAGSAAMATARACPRRGGPLAPARRRAPPAPHGRLWTLTTVAHVIPFLGAGALLCRCSRSRCRWRCLPRARLDHPRALRPARRERPAPARPAGGAPRGDAEPSGARSACSATWSATRRASCTRAPGSSSSAAGWASGSSGRPAPAADARRPARPLLLREGRPRPRPRARCRRATASPTCCSRCAATSRAPRPSPTSPFAGAPLALAPPPAQRDACPALDPAPRTVQDNGSTSGRVNPGQRANVRPSGCGAPCHGHA